MRPSTIRARATGASRTTTGTSRCAPGQFGGQISQGEGKTDAQGRFSFSVPADINKFQRSQRFTFDITVQDVNNQAVSTQTSAVVHKGEFYIGLSPRSYVVTQGEPAQVDVITVDAQSQPVPDTKVDLVVSQIEWISVREKAEDGNSYWVSRPKKTPVITETLTTDAKGAAVLNWTPKAPGEYKIEATGRDRVGHAIRSAAYTWVSGPNYVPWRHGEQRPHQAGGRQIGVRGRRHRRDPGAEPLSRQGQGAADHRARPGAELEGHRAGGQQRSHQAADHRRRRAEHVRLARAGEGDGQDDAAGVVQGRPGAAQGLGGRQGAAGDPDAASGRGRRARHGARHGQRDPAPTGRAARHRHVGRADAGRRGQARAGRRLAGAGGQGRADAGRRQRRQADGSLLLSTRAGRADRRAPGC